MAKTLPTIIIPAHNEANIIAKTLENLKEGVQQHYQIIVVCNGCNDNTVKVASSFEHVQCEEITIASKIAAIRHAESLNPTFPRLYLDADITLTANDAVHIFQKMQNDLHAGLYIPRSNTNTEHSHFTVKSYYKTWYKTPFVKRLGYGSGAYAFTQKGRERFSNWPNVVSDDGFVRSHFNQDEIHIIENICVDVIAPKTWWQLIRIKARSKYGTLQLKKHLKKELESSIQLRTNKEAKTSFKLSQLASKLNYIIINTVALVWAHWMMKTDRFFWLKDNSNH